MNIPEKLSTTYSGTVDIIKTREAVNQIITCLHDIEARLPKPEAPKRWRADFDKKYWFLTHGGKADWVYEAGDDEDDFRYNTGNYFASEAEAVAYREQLLANGAQV